MHCLADHSSHSVEHQHVRLHRLTSRAIRDGAKRIHKIPNPNCWPVLMKEETAVQKVLILIIGAIFGRAHPQKLFKINMSNFAD